MPLRTLPLTQHLTELENDVYTNYNNYVYLNIVINRNSSYTAPVDGEYFFIINGSDGATGMLFLDSAHTKQIAQVAANATVSLRLKANTTIYTRDTYGTYWILGYNPR